MSGSGFLSLVEVDPTGDPWDFWRTPAWAVAAIEPRLAQSIRRPGAWICLEPSAGEGDLCLALQRSDLSRVFCSGIAVELHQGRAERCAARVPEWRVMCGDFFDGEVRRAVRLKQAGGLRLAVIGNPPYRPPAGLPGALEFVCEALDLAAPRGLVAMLLPLDFAAGVQRYRRVHRSYRCSCFALASRPSFGGGATGKRPVAWFIWDLSRPDRAEFGVLAKGDT